MAKKKMNLTLYPVRLRKDQIASLRKKADGKVPVSYLIRKAIDNIICECD